MLDPRICFGRPTIRGTRIKVEIVADMAQAGESIRAIAREFSVTERQAREAIAWWDGYVAGKRRRRGAR